jgi:hypothetical protein
MLHQIFASICYLNEIFPDLLSPYIIAALLCQSGHNETRSTAFLLVEFTKKSLSLKFFFNF